MDKIIELLLHSASFLYNEYSCRFVDSQVSKSFGGDAVLVLATEKLRLRLISDRSQLFCDFTDTSSDLGAKCKWFSIGVVRKYLTCETEFFDELDVGNISFLQREFHNIEDMFYKSSLLETQKELHKLEVERAKRLFG